MTARYSFSPDSRYCAIRVALPTHSARTPVASGSSVPVCPILFSFSIHRAFCTTSWDVIPDGLLILTTPSLRIAASCARLGIDGRSDSAEHLRLYLFPIAFDGPAGRVFMTAAAERLGEPGQINASLG